MRNSAASSRFSPSWWNHQRHVLVALRRALGRVVTDRLNLQPGQRVVDMGCGDAPYRRWFDEAGCDYVRCDLEGDVDVRLTPPAPVGLPSASIDGVLSFQVLEHVWDVDWYLGESFRLLRPGGWLLLSTHGTWPYHPHPTDFRRWTRDGLAKEVAERGFTLQHLEGVVGPLAWTTQIRLLGWREGLRRIPLAGPILLVPIVALANLRMVLEDAITPASARESNACVYVVLARKAASPEPSRARG